MKLKRVLLSELVAEQSRREVGIVIGPRQAGKTTLLRAVAAHCRRQKLPCRYFDLEQPGDTAFFARGHGELLADIGRSRQVLLIDEFHYLPDATRLFKALFDGYQGVKVFASGSSALEMHRHLRESLAGRRRLYRVFPLSFAEWLPGYRRGLHLPDTMAEVIAPARHQHLRAAWAEFLIFGGMPGLVHEQTAEARKRLLLDLVATFINKDIKALLREEDILSFNRLLVMLAAQEGTLLSEQGTSQHLNYSLRQVRKDLSILNQMFVLELLKPYFTNRGRELKQTMKTYFFDSGLRNAILRDFRPLAKRPDQGALREWFVMQELRKNLRLAQEVYYWRTRQQDEVDFILEQDRQPLPIEVKAALKQPEIPPGLRQFLKQYPEAPAAIVLNDNLTATMKIGNRSVYFLPHYYAPLLPSAFAEGKVG